MRITAYDLEKVPYVQKYKLGTNQSLIDEFAASGLKCAKVEGWTHKSAYHCQSSLQQAIVRGKRAKMYKAIARKGEVFLIRLDV